jgi:hypothetical protein
MTRKVYKQIQEIILLGMTATQTTKRLVKFKEEEDQANIPFHKKGHILTKAALK